MSRTRIAAVVAGCTILALVLGPAGAHVGGSIRHLWGDHISGKVASRYLLQNGRTMISTESGWETPTTQANVSLNGNAVTRVERSSPGTTVLFLFPDIPVALNHYSMRMDSAQICYDTVGTSATITDVKVFRRASPFGQNDQLIAGDEGDHLDKTCRLYESPGDPRLLPTDTVYVRMEISVSDTAQDLVELGRTTFELKPYVSRGVRPLF